MNNKKIFLILILFLTFFNINIVKADVANFTFYEKDGWTYKDVKKYGIIGVCNDNAEGYCKKSSNVDGCYATCEASGKDVIYENGDLKYNGKGLNTEKWLAEAFMDGQKGWNSFYIIFNSEERMGNAVKSGPLTSTCSKYKDAKKLADVKLKSPLNKICFEGNKISDEKIKEDAQKSYDTKTVEEEAKAANYKKYVLDKLIIDDDEEIKKLSTCEGILGDKIIDIIQSLVNIVRVAIPIVLIVYGIIDFGKAAFSFDESEMKKAQGKFIKRLIIGITFFLIPVVIGILLKVGHMVWGDVIGTSICGIEF